MITVKGKKLHLNHLNIAPRHERGASLVSVMVSLLMNGLGLYAGLQLQIRGMEGVQTSSNQTAALLLAEDILERMRANPTQTLLGAYAVTALEALAVGQSASYVDCGATDCTSVQLREYDLGSWRENFPPTLTDISVDVLERSSDPAIWAVIVRWDEDRNGAVGENCLATGANVNLMECISLEASF